jgi:tripartite-type tricarboxylate transporter receptor subunit TctC
MPAGGGIVGMQALKGKPADGYTWLLGTSSMLTVTPQLRRNLPYDPERDVTLVGMVGLTNNVVVVGSAVPAKSLQEFIDYARQRPGQLNFASNGIGTPAHIGGEALNQEAGIKLTHVPYKGSAQALTDLAGGQIAVVVTSPLAAGAIVRSGKARMLATTGRTRDPLYPQLPTASSVLPNYELSQWFALLVSSGTPPGVQERIGTALAAALKDPQLVETLRMQGVEVKSMSRGDLLSFVAQQRAYYGKIIRDGNLKED